MRGVLLGMLLGLLGEHEGVSLAVVRPHRGCHQFNALNHQQKAEDAQTCAASTTLLCLNGLKSSLMCAAVFFLIGRVPKKGFGVVGAYQGIILHRAY